MFSSLRKSLSHHAKSAEFTWITDSTDSRNDHYIGYYTQNSITSLFKSNNSKTGFRENSSWEIQNKWIIPQILTICRGLRILSCDLSYPIQANDC